MNSMMQEMLRATAGMTSAERLVWSRMRDAEPYLSGECKPESLPGAPMTWLGKDKEQLDGNDRDNHEVWFAWRCRLERHCVRLVEILGDLGRAGEFEAMETLIDAASRFCSGCEAVLKPLAELYPPAVFRVSGQNANAVQWLRWQLDTYGIQVYALTGPQVSTPIEAYEHEGDSR